MENKPTQYNFYCASQDSVFARCNHQCDLCKEHALKCEIEELRKWKESAMENNRIQFAITKKNPKPNAPSYTIATLQDIADCITSENADRFLHEFEVVIRSIVLLKTAADISTSEKGAVNNEKILFPQFTWIDD